MITLLKATVTVLDGRAATVFVTSYTLASALRGATKKGIQSYLEIYSSYSNFGTPNYRFFNIVQSNRFLMNVFID